MRHYVILLLLVLHIFALAAEAPVLIIRNGEPFVRLALVSPSVGISVSYNAEMQLGSIKCKYLEEGFFIKWIAKNDKRYPYLAIFPDYPDSLFISQKGLNNFHVTTYFDKKKKQLVLFNQDNGSALELTENTDTKTVSDHNISQKNIVYWDIEKLKELLTRHPELLKNIGAKLICNFANYGDIPAMTVLLDAGISPDSKIDEKDWNDWYFTPLEHTIGNNQPKAAIFLLSRGATITDKVFLKAIFENDVESVKVMLDYKYDPNIINDEGLTALQIAATNKQLEIVKLLVKYGAKVDARTKDQETPLLLATKPDEIKFDGGFTEEILLGDSDIVSSVAEYLIASGADINACDNSQHTVLYNSVRSINSSLYNLLRANPKMKPVDKTTRSNLLLALMESAVNLQKQIEILVPLMIELSSRINTNKDRENLKNDNYEKEIKPPVMNLPIIFDNLLTEGVDLKIKDKNSKTVLDYAVQLHDTTFARKLIDAGADINYNASICNAVKALNTEGVKFLLEKGANIEGIQLYGMLDQTSMKDNLSEEQKIAEHDDVMAIANLLVKYKADMKLRDGGGQAIHHAARMGYPDLVALLLDNGADIEAGDKDNTTPLGIAAQVADVKIMALLIKRGAKVNACNNKNNTPLSLIMPAGSLDGVKLLLSQPGIDVKKKNSNGCTIMMLTDGGHFGYYDESFEKWLPTLGQELLKRGCKINDIDNDKRTALHHAVLNNHLEYTQFLISHGAKINQPDKDGNTPLHLSLSHYATIEMIKMLLKNGADVYARNKVGKRVIDFAKEYKGSDIAESLLKYKK